MLAVQVRPEAVHAVPVLQHGCFEPPQVAHTPAAVHPRLAAHAIMPPQHGSPAPPHAAHTPFPVQPSPDPHESPAQQG
jgi:hypothetical protein